MSHYYIIMHSSIMTVKYWHICPTMTQD